MNILTALKNKVSYVVYLTAVLVTLSTSGVTATTLKKLEDDKLNSKFSKVQVDIKSSTIQKIVVHLSEANKIAGELDRSLEGETFTYVGADEVSTYRTTTFLDTTLANKNRQITLALNCRKQVYSAFGEISKLADVKTREAYADSASMLINFCDEALTFMVQYEASQFYRSMIYSKDKEQLNLALTKWSEVDEKIRSQILLLKKNDLNSAARILTDMWNRVVADMDALKAGKACRYSSYFRPYF